jgi:hypothetical protein
MHGDYRLEATIVETPEATAWMMSHGSIDGIDVSGLTVLMVPPGPVVILDEDATPEQAEAVRDLFHERGVGFYLAPMTLRSRQLFVSIPERRIECRLTLPEARRKSR